MSISKAQANALADGFLETLGTSDEFSPKESFSEIILLAGELVEDAQKNLEQSNSNASGNLSASLKASEPVLTGQTLRVDIMMNFYGLFVNRGVKGTKSGSGQYAFKGDRPPASMVEAIAQWAKAGKLKTANTNKAKSISKNEVKNASIGELSKFYAVARYVLQHGIKKTGFLDKAIISTQNKVSDRLGVALKVDVINSITS